ncbi:MAG: fibronectin type III domain-containing protein [Litoreibacter sp.]
MPTFLFRNTNTNVQTELTGVMPYDVGNLLPDGTYTVRAISDEAPDTITINSVTVTPPAQVTGLIVVPGNGFNTLSWETPHDGGASLMGYVLTVDTGGGSEILPNEIGINTSFTHTGLSNGTAYSYTVAAVNSAGTGVASSLVSGTPIASDIESDALGHWLLGDDNSSDQDLLSGQALTPNGAAPMRMPGYLTITGAGNGLLTAISDAPDITFCAVIRRPSGAGPAIIGGTMPSGSSPVEGWSPFMSEPEMLRMRNKGGTESVTLDDAAPVDQFYFLAMSLSASGAHVYFRGGNLGNVVDSGNAGRGTVRNVNVALGDVYFNNSSWDGDVDCAELIVWHSAKTESELNDIFLRSKARLAARGIAVQAQ